VAVLPHQLIEQRLQQAVRANLPDTDVATVLVRPCPDPKFGDYQTNALMSLAKARKMNPRQLATDVVANLDVGDCCEKVEIAGAGFLNFRLKPAALAQALESAAHGEHLFFAPAPQPRTVVVDFSSPNVAKPMHVGHIRSTILGDSLARTLRLLGHQVITDNHLGDWGAQFGMLIVGWIYATACGQDPSKMADPIDELERLYKLVTAASRGEPEPLRVLREKLKPPWLFVPDGPDGILQAARDQLAQLQRGDGTNTQIWKTLISLSRRQFDTIYQRLGVKFDHTLGESFYNPRLKPLVDELVAKGIARASEGAIAVFFEDIPTLKEHPALIQKSDGAFNYTTTDLATLAHRLETWRPDEIVYVTDARQQLHFQQLFAVFRRWRPEAKVNLAHVWFGSILGEDGKPFKTRSGETIKLADLLDEAEERAFKVVSEKSPELPEAQQREIARIVGIGAIKYADLLPNRQSDYVFSWDKLLALNGNTAPYLQYAYARIRSIFRKSNVGQGVPPVPPSESLVTHRVSPPSLRLDAPEELALARHLLNFGLVLEAVAEDYRPNFLCNYLYELAGCFTGFYENCPVLKSEPAQRASRLVLCDLTARVLKQGLDVLGIETLEQM
jgi:arginyl-tRNA synthetase